MSPPVAAILGFLKILFFLLLEIPFLVLWGIHAENVYFFVVVLFWSVFSWRFLSHFQEMLVSLTPHRIALGKCCSERESFPLAGRDGEGEEVGGGGGGGGPLLPPPPSSTSLAPRQLAETIRKEPEIADWLHFLAQFMVGFMSILNNYFLAVLMAVKFFW